jgi:hypothetical protein
MGTTLGVEVGAPLESRLGAELGTLLDPSANFNTIISSKFNSNGSEGIPDLRLPGADIVYVQSQQEFLGKPNDNCISTNWYNPITDRWLQYYWCFWLPMVRRVERKTKIKGRF